MTTEEVEKYGIELEATLSNFRRNQFGEEKHSDLSRMEYRFLFILAYCQKEQQVTPSDLAKILGVSLAAITHHLNSLEEQGMIERTVAPSDRRVVHIGLSRQGQETVQALKKKINQKMRNVVAYLGEADTQKLIELLQKISQYRQAHND